MISGMIPVMIRFRSASWLAPAPVLVCVLAGMIAARAGVPAAPAVEAAPTPETAKPSGPQKAAAPAEPSTAPTGEAAPSPPAAPPSEILVQMKALFDAGSDDAAIETGEAWLKEHPSDVDVRLAVVHSLVRIAIPLRVAGHRFLTTAWNHIQAARVTAPDRMDVRLAGCDVLYHLGRRETLQEEIVSYLKDAPSKDEALDTVGFYAEQDVTDGRPDDGAKLYAVIVGVLKDSATAALNHGTMLVLAGRLEDGLAEFQRAYRLDPKSASAAHNAAQALVYLGDYARAEEWMQKALAIDGGNGRFITDLAVLRSLSKPQEARALFEKASGILGSIPAQKILVENLRVALTGTARTDESAAQLVEDLQRTGYPIYALVAAEKALRADPNQPEIVLTRADIYDQGRFWKRSLEQYRSGSELARRGGPGATRFQEWSVSGMARALTGLGDPQRAVELLNENGGSEQFPFEMAEAMWRSGNGGAAMDLLEHLSTSKDEDIARAARQKMQQISSSTR